jgi:hypothetical protein
LLPDFSAKWLVHGEVYQLPAFHRQKSGASDPHRRPISIDSASIAHGRAQCPPKITFAEMRAARVRRLLVYRFDSLLAPDGDIDDRIRRWRETVWKPFF